MTFWANTETGEVISTQEMIASHPNTIFPIPFEPVDGYVQLEETLPSYDPAIQKLIYSSTATEVNGKWTREITVIDLTPVERRALLPDSCTPAQGLVALFALKSITEGDIHTAIAGITDPVDRYTAQIAFTKATEWRRGSPSVQMLAALLGLSEGDLDVLFSYAATVTI